MDSKALLLLAQDRDQSTCELLQSNDFYGNATLLKRISGLPAGYSLKVMLEHAIYLVDPVNYFWEAELLSGMPVLVCANAPHAEAFTDLTGKPAFPIGSLILYALPQRDGKPAIKPPGSDRVLIVPTHSSHHVDVMCDHDTLINAARQVYPGKKLMALLYWKDILRGMHEYYIQQGITVRTAGHIFDSYFMPRQAALLMNASHIVTNCIGSHVIFSMLLGRPVWCFNQKITYYGSPFCKTAPTTYEATLSKPQLELMELCSTPRDHVTAQQAGYVNELAGVAQFKTPKQLMEIFLLAEKLFKLGA